ncbi:MAG: hypothetical protein R3F34_11005 [Planctomycetota bacterium]
MSRVLRTLVPFVLAALFSGRADAQNPASAPTTTGQTLEVTLLSPDTVDEGDTSFLVTACARLQGGAGATTQIVELIVYVNGDPVLASFSSSITELCLTDVEVLQELSLFGPNLIEATARTADGTVVTATKEIVKTACLLMLGLAPDNHLLFPNDVDRVLVQPWLYFSVTEAEVPKFWVPPYAQFMGLDVYFQVGMHNAAVFPQNPVQMSNGVHVTLGGGAVEYGAATGISSWCEGSTAPNGTFEIRFDVLAM